MVEWLKSALATVYSKDGLIGIAVIVALIAGVIALLWYLSIDPTQYIGG